MAPLATEDAERNSRLLAETLARHAQRLANHARRHAERPADAEEALQTACLRFLERYNPAAEPIAWLYTTIKHEAWAMRRRRSRRRELGFEDFPKADGSACDLSEILPGEGSTPEERVVRAELHAARRAALEDLKPDERTALVLLGFGLSYAEIAGAQGWTHTKTNRCLAEGRAALRRREPEPLSGKP